MLFFVVSLFGGLFLTGVGGKRLKTRWVTKLYNTFLLFLKGVVFDRRWGERGSKEDGKKKTCIILLCFFCLFWGGVFDRRRGKRFQKLMGKETV